ncbi:pectin acetylesterase-family hydrolase [Oligoflexus tunisiensis]|uniref:pectin acetylesterase-family hydrolase n=1 Tax=Oligoflexus tunisiensis TaxID=708132 RepID=UPI00114CBC24|nr:pectin acetylesterase-family hydrolase [Oligoflexus tunisiensis]
MGARRRRIALSFFALTLGLSAESAVAQTASWEWQAVTGTMCRDGSETGFFLKRRPFDKNLVIYLEGGGACFNGLTCLSNPKAVGDQYPGQNGIFQERDDNPVNGWNFVHVPYCSGDIFAGSQENVQVPGVLGRQHFVGYRNMLKILDRLKTEMPELENVLMTGVSAGGFGAIFHYPTAKERWPDSRVVLLNDSGIPLEDEWLAPCLQKSFRTLWGIDTALPEDCTDCSGEDGGGLVNLARYLRERYGDHDKGMIMSLQDGIMRFFYGFGVNECKPPLIPNYPAQEFEAGVRSLRENFLQGGIPTFFQNGSQHVYISSKSFYETKANGQSLSSWVRDLLNLSAQDRGP